MSSTKGMDMRLTRVVAVGAAAVMVVAGATVVSAVNPAPESWVFVARGDNPVDALGAASLAGTLNAPVILTEQSVLTDDAREALVATDPDNVVIAGGFAAITAEVESTIRSAVPGAEVRRLAGETRYDTSQLFAALLTELDPAFLGVDGKANAAELADRALEADTATLANRATTADLADDSDALGGLAAEEYVFTTGAIAHKPVEADLPDDTNDETLVIDLIDPVTVDVPADGVLAISAQMVVFSSEFLQVVVLVDYDGPESISIADEEGANALYAALAALSAPDAGATTAITNLSTRQPVTAGTHEVRLVTLHTGDNDPMTDETYMTVFGELTATFLPNSDVTRENLEVSDVVRRSTAGSDPLGLFSGR